jgi:hypothetical protein
MLAVHLLPLLWRDGGFGTKENMRTSIADAVGGDMEGADPTDEDAVQRWNCHRTFVEKGFMPAVPSFHDKELLDFVNTHRESEQKSVAFVIRGDINRQGEDFVEGKRVIAGAKMLGGCVHCSHQEIAIASIVENIFKPLEEHGYRVDVFASYYNDTEDSTAKHMLALFDSGKKRVVSYVAAEERLSDIRYAYPQEMAS